RPGRAGLMRLALSGKNTGPKGANELADSQFLTNLRWLDLNRNRLGAEGAEALAASPGLSRLRHLSLWDNDIGARGARAVMLSPHLSGLRSLDLTGSHFTDGTARAVAPKTPLVQLRRLFVGDDRKLTKEGERLLAASASLPHLLQLHRVRYPFYADGDVSRVLLKEGKGREL